MNPSKGNEQTIFDAARQVLDPQARKAYLDEVCGADAALRERIEALLAASLRADDFLAGDPLEFKASRRSSVAESVPEGPGTTIEKYKLLEKLGEGGFGTVYMAEQKQPVKRRVALKIIKVGMDTREVVARFEAERQALALMDHPNIAKVFDAGATQTGRPYFVMELVRGVKITDYCDEKHLSTRERLTLFMHVCQAVQHAHQKGIIHRDLKPSNILVTVNDGVAVPKIIDFGIAKATQMELTEKTVFTRFQQFIGTPAYISPEQAELSSVDVDTRSDIYSLGVLLYELLTGQTPFDAKELLKSGLDEMRRMLREKEPERPSTRVRTLGANELTTTAKRRGLEAPKLVNSLRGDLDWIVMKCLEKDRARRYETANGLAMDIQRHLSNETVEACPPSNLYRFQKVVRRHKGAFAAAAIILISMIIGAGVSTWESVRARRAEREQAHLRRDAEAARDNEARQRRQAEANEKKAQSESSKSRQVAQVLKDMLNDVGELKALGRDTTMLRELVDKTVARMGKDLTNQPEAEVEIGVTLAETYLNLGLKHEAEKTARNALELGRARLGDEAVVVAAALRTLGVALREQGKLSEAESASRQALESRRKLLGAQHAAVAESLADVALVLMKEDKLIEAERYMREALTMQRIVPGPDNPAVAASLNDLAVILARQGKIAEAGSLYSEAVALSRKLHAEAGLEQGLANLGLNLMRQGKVAEAEAALREALTLARNLYGKEDARLGDVLQSLGDLLKSLGKQAEAEELMREQLALVRKRTTDGQLQESPELGHALHHLADLVREQKHLAEARSLAEEAVSIYRRHSDWSPPERMHSLHVLTRVLRELDDLGAAEELWRQELAAERKLRGNDDPYTAIALKSLGEIADARGRLSEAEAMTRQAVGIVQTVPGYETEHAGFLWNLGDLLQREGKLGEAETAYRGALSIEAKRSGEQDPWTTQVLGALKELLMGEKKYSDAEDLLNSALKSAPTGSQEYPDLLTMQADFFARRGRWTEAAADLKQVIDLRPDDHFLWHSLAPLLSQIGSPGAYRQHCRRSLERFAHTTDPNIAERVAKDCLILPNSDADLETVTKMAELAVSRTNHQDWVWFLLCNALAEYRQGRLAGAAHKAREVLDQPQRDATRDVQAHMVFAMAQYRLEQLPEAQAAYNEGQQIMDTKLPKAENGDLGVSWLDWIIADALLREARELLKGKG